MEVLALQGQKRPLQGNDPQTEKEAPFPFVHGNGQFFHHRVFRHCRGGEFFTQGFPGVPIVYPEGQFPGLSQHKTGRGFPRQMGAVLPVNSWFPKNPDG